MARIRSWERWESEMEEERRKSGGKAVCHLTICHISKLSSPPRHIPGYSIYTFFLSVAHSDSRRSWSHCAPTVSMDPSYKARKEAFVSNLSGGSIWEINAVTLVAPVCTPVSPLTMSRSFR